MKYGYGFGKYVRPVVAGTTAALAGRLLGSKSKASGTPPANTGTSRKRKYRIRLGMKRRRTRSKRRKMSKKYNAAQEVSQHNNDNSIHLSPLTIGKAKLPHKYKFKYQVIRQRTQSGVQGTQLVMLCPAVGALGQLNGTTTNLRNVYEQWDADPYKLNPFSGILAVNTIYPGPFPAIVANDKLYWHGYNHHLSIINLSTVPCTASVCWLLCNNNASVTPIAAWDNVGGVEEALTQPGQVASALLATNTATGGFTGSTTYGAFPYEHKTFRKYWKLLDRFDYTLQPGDQVNLSRKINMNKIITKQWMTNQTNTYLKGITIYPMIIARAGLVGVATAGGGNPAAEVAYGACKLGIVDNQEHHFGGVPIGNNLATTRVYQGTIVNDVVDELKHIIDTDAVATVGTA